MSQIKYPNHKWVTTGTTISRCSQCSCIRQAVPMMDGKLHGSKMRNERSRNAFKYKLGNAEWTVVAPPCIGKSK